MKRVVLITEVLTHYRVPLHNILGAELAKNGVEYRVVYGRPEGVNALKRDNRRLAQYGLEVRNRYINIGGLTGCWQPTFLESLGFDLIIVEQANRHIINYPLLALQLLGLKRVAFWGHGRNFQSEKHTARERFKRLVARMPHWWFAYNELSQRVVESIGFPSARITNLQNAVDTTTLVTAANKVLPQDLCQLRTEYGLTDKCVVYIGGMYAEKRLRFLIEALVKARHLEPNLTAIFIGAGPDAYIVEAAAETHHWIRYVGPKFSEDLVRHALIGKLMVMPGLVGLAILDSFALKIPMITTNVGYHSPEIHYLKNGENGVIVDDLEDVSGYAAAIVDLLNDERALELLRRGCEESRSLFSIEEMANRFHQGIMSALAAPRRQ